MDIWKSPSGIRRLGASLEGKPAYFSTPTSKVREEAGNGVWGQICARAVNPPFRFVAPFWTFQTPRIFAAPPRVPSPGSPPSFRTGFLPFEAAGCLTPSYVRGLRRRVRACALGGPSGDFPGRCLLEIIQRTQLSISPREFPGEIRKRILPLLRNAANPVQQKELGASCLPTRPGPTPLSPPNVQTSPCRYPPPVQPIPELYAPPVRLQSLLKLGICKTASSCLSVRFRNSQSRHLSPTPLRQFGKAFPCLSPRDPSCVCGELLLLPPSSSGQMA